MAKKLNISRIHIEGDSMVVINACLNRKMGNLRIGYILKKAWEIIDSFEVKLYSHTLGEGNNVTDMLSNLGCD